MFDAIPENTPSHSDWKTKLAIGDLVMFRYPLADEQGEAEPKARPCLVLDLRILGDMKCAVIAYGTTAHTAANRGLDLHVVRPDEIAAAGLHRPTRIVCARRVTVSLEHRDWVIHPGLGTPVIGRLTGDSGIAMKRMRGRVLADEKRLRQVVRPWFAATPASAPIVEIRSAKRARSAV